MPSIRLAFIPLTLLLASCALPKLPSLPSLTQIKDATLGVGSSGDSAHDAVKLAAATADAWATSVTLVDVHGTRIDPGGRDHGWDDGAWLVAFQSTLKPLVLEVSIANGKVVGQAESAQRTPAVAVDRSLSGILDSTDAVKDAKLSAQSYTVILRGTASGPRYDVLGENDGTSVTLDAQSGAVTTN